jgi:D-alanyl-D-alanine carboxypeptidase
MQTLSTQRRHSGLSPLARSTALSLLLIGAAACNDDARDGEDATSSPLELDAQAVLDAHQAQQEFPGAVLALHDPVLGDVQVTSGATRPGSAGAPVDPQVPWGIGSVTKTFVAVVVLQLAEEGALDLDASIEPYFPELPRAADISARQLLQHTSGLNEYFESPAVAADLGRPWSPLELVDAAVALGPVGEPGAGYHYSNTNYVLLGQLVLQLTGRRWDAAVRERILEPLGMQHTHYIGQELAPPLGRGFRVEDGTFVEYTHHDHPSTGDAAGGLQSTATDLLRFTRALLDGSLLDVQRQTEMETFVPGESQGYVAHEYGLGLEKYTANELTVYGHLGTSAAHASFIGFEPISGVAVSVLINAAEPPPPAFMAFEAIAAITGKDVSPPRTQAQ